MRSSSHAGKKPLKASVISEQKQLEKSQLVLGTAQLGMDYGIANVVGKQDKHSAFEILNAAYEAGIRFFDTAQNYGDSEEIIGAYLKQNLDREFRVITKLNSVIDKRNKQEIIDAVELSSNYIGKTLEGVLLHDPAWINSWDKTIEDALEECIEKKYIKSYGISVYTPEEMNTSLSIKGINIIQMPVNVFDRRFISSGLIPEALKRGKALFVRSAFLQGLLVMPLKKAVERIPMAEKYLERWHKFCVKINMLPVEVALKYVCTVLPNAQIIVGTESPEQILANSKLARGYLPEELINEINNWESPPEEVFNPSKWKKTTI
jgi:aryl-alcohol dehydrogenase-like predicted oxidoreductase